MFLFDKLFTVDELGLINDEVMIVVGGIVRGAIGVGMVESSCDDGNDGDSVS